MSQKSRNSYFSKNKRPLREATTIGYLFRIYPKRINSFLQRSQKSTFSKTVETCLYFTYQNPFFAENQNGPYGLYEQLLKDGIGNYWQKKGVMDQNWNFGGVENLKIQFWGSGRGFQSLNKSKIDFKNILDYSRSILDKFSYIFILFSMKIGYFQLKSIFSIKFPR